MKRILRRRILMKGRNTDKENTDEERNTNGRILMRE
jgi:hypothetical protein